MQPSWASFHAPASRVVDEERPRPGLPAQAPGSRLWTIPGCLTAPAAACGFGSAAGAIGVRSTAARTAAPMLAGRAGDRRGVAMRRPSRVDGGMLVGSGRLAVGSAARSKWRPSRITVPQSATNGSNACLSAHETRRSPTVIVQSTLAAAISAAVLCPTSFASISSSTRVVSGIADAVVGRRVA